MSSSVGPKSVSSALAVLCNQNGKHFIFEDQNIIGRSPSAFISITNNQISRKHCLIVKTEENKFTIRDMSCYGTFVNDQRLKRNQAQELNHNDRINLAGLEEYSYIFLYNRKHCSVKCPPKLNIRSPLTEKMIDLNESQSVEKGRMDRELSLFKTEMHRLKEELQEELKTREDELERERLKLTTEAVYNKEQADKVEMKLKEMIEEKERTTNEHESKIKDVTKKVQELEDLKNEMEKRHLLEREELENKCKAEIEDLKKKLEEKEIKHQQFEELQARLEETKNVLLESEMEQQRLFEAKVEIETKLESKIVDLTSERENNEVQVKELKKKLKEKEEQEEKVKKEIAGLEDDMMCSICAEMYVEPTALNCGHMFCKLCINEWNKKKKICPMCRAKISTTVRIFNMDSVIEKNIRLMPEEARSRREALIAERKRGKTPRKERSAKKKRRENHPRVRPEPTVSIDLAAGSPLANVNHNNRTQGSQNRTFSLADMESESIDPFQVGWVTNPALRNVRPVGRNSPVTVAAIDLTNYFEARTSARTHTVTSADANSTIDLTNI